MMLRLTQLHFAAVILTIAAIPLTSLPARAFTMENLSANPNGNSRFADPDDQVKNFGPGARPFGQNGPIVQFGVQPGVQPPFGHSPGFGFAPSPPPPQPYNLNNNN
jgi:hypothetical protein